MLLRGQVGGPIPAGPPLPGWVGWSGYALGPATILATHRETTGAMRL